MTKLIVFTDLHLLPEGGRIIGIDPYERLRRGILHARAHHADAERVIMTGDLAHRGERAAYERLRALLGLLPVPVDLMVGNHDDRDAFAEVFPETPRDENGFVQTAFDFGATRIVLLDTLNGPPYDHPQVSSGRLCPKRLDWLDRQLAAADRPVLVFMHHPPGLTGFPGMDRIRLIDEDAFHQVLARHGNVRHIFAGHVHRTIGGSWRGVPFSIFKSPAHQQPMVLDVDDKSLSVDEPAAYGIVLLGGGDVIVHTEDYEIARHDTRPAPEALGGL